MEPTSGLSARDKRLVVLVVVGVTVGTLGGLFALVHRTLFPPPNIVYVDNAGAAAVMVKIDGHDVDTLAPRGARGALSQRDLPNGRHVVEAFDGARRVAHHELDLSGQQCVVVVGGVEAIAVDVVPYGSGTPVAHLATSNADGTVWAVDMKNDVAEGLDEAFPKTVTLQQGASRKTLRHLCRVVSGEPQCPGGPTEITSPEHL